MRALSKIFAIGVVVISVAAGCGGSSDSAPGPLSKHFDDMYIAQIPLDQKQSIVQTQNDWSIAKMENAKADADLNETSSQLSIVKNDHKAAKLAIDSAVSAKKSAEASSDMNRVNTAQKDLRGAEDSEKAAAQRVKYFEAYRNYLKRFHRYTMENMYWREAQYENAKAQIAKSNNIAPKGINLADFPKQLDERGKRVEGAKQKAESEKQKAVSARQTWLAAQQSADKQTGRTGTLYDPMQPKEGGPAMKDGGIAQEKPEQIKPLNSTPGNMGGQTVTPTPANATGGSDGSAAQPQQ